jgi:RNA polymerase sigma-70 factor (ECF subfamily)
MISCLSCPQTYGSSGYRDIMAAMAKIPEDSETTLLIEQAVRGDQQALSKLLGRHRDRLRRMVALRLDRRLQGRVDPSDIIQEACVDAARRLPEFHQNPTIPFFLWLRLLTGQRLVDEHRKHLGAAARDAGREISLYRGALPETSSAALAAHLLGRASTPSQAAIRAEQKIRLQEALNILEPIDREVLLLRHFEELSNGEAAAVLGLDKSAASKRYARALIRIKDVLSSLPGGLDAV